MMVNIHDSVLALTQECLTKLIDDKFVLTEQVALRFNVIADQNGKLASQGLLAATTLEREVAILVYPKGYNISDLAAAISHESVHVAQICKGDLVPGTIESGTSEWKGQVYDVLPADSPDYFSKAKQPWEYEAKSMEQDLLDHLKELYPDDLA